MTGHKVSTLINEQVFENFFEILAIVERVRKSKNILILIAALGDIQRAARVGIKAAQTLEEIRVENKQAESKERKRQANEHNNAQQNTIEQSS